MRSRAGVALGLWVALSALSIGDAHDEVVGDLWAQGTHAGTARVGSCLTLAPGERQGVWTQRVPARAPFDRLLLSLNPAGAFPPGSKVVTSVRVQVGEAWTPWLPLGTYGGAADLPRSIPSRPALGVSIETDLLVAKQPARAAELRLELSRTGADPPPRIARVVVDCWRRTRKPPAHGAPSPAWGKTVTGVSTRSQTVEDPRIAGRICSPTSLSMALDRWGAGSSTATIASAVYDRGAKIYGNWSFNVAHAGALGLDARAVHLTGWPEIEAEIVAGRPVVVSHRFRKGELGNAPIEATDGHLIVIVGFTATGDVVVHDPASSPRQNEAIRRVYKRDELAKTIWVNAEGVGYLLRR